RNYWLENGYEIDIEEIRRIINFRVEYEIMKTKEFMENYMMIKELDDEGVIKELRRWYSTNAMECPLCNKMILKKEAIEYNKEFIGEICRSCFERKEEDTDGIDKRIRELKEMCDEMKIIVTEGGLLRLTSMGYTDGQILDEEFIEIFQENRNELEEELRKKLDKLLKEQAGIVSSEESGERSDNEESEKEDTDDSEKIGEILNPEEHEIWEENTKDFEENEFENNNENILNTEGFGLSQNSDSNNSLNNKNSDIEDSDTGSELTDYNLQDLFQENELLNMANRDEIRADNREDLRMFGNVILGHDIGNDWNALAPPVATIFGRINEVETRIGNLAGPVNRAAKVGDLPLYYGGDQDPYEWIRDFEVVWNANGYQPGANQVDKIRKAAACMRGEAADWYENKRDDIQRWEENTHHHGNNNFTKLLKDHYASDVRKNQWIRELQTIRQEMDEKVGAYASRFRKLIRKVAPGVNDLGEMYKVNYFIQGLNPVMVSRVMETAPATLDAAIERAKIIETGNQMMIQSMTNQSLLNRNNVQNNEAQDVRQNSNG